MTTIRPDRRATPHSSLREGVTHLLWFWATAALVLTLALVIVGGTSYVASPTVQLVLAALFASTAIHVWRQHRRRDELRRDPRLRRGRERRGY